MKSRSQKTNISIVAQMLVAHGVRHVVVCPGSRNAPLVHTLANTDGLQCHPVTDERSAAFVAIGMSDATGSPVAVCCTSGSALLNMAPAVAEAYHRNVPLIVISADRPEAWIGQMDGQTLQQPRAFEPWARSFHLPEPHDDVTLWQCRRDANAAMLALRHGGGEPVHINIPVSEPLFGFVSEPWPDVRRISAERNSSISLSADAMAEWRRANKVMIIIGQMPSGNGLNEHVDALVRSGAVVIAEHLSNVQAEGVVGNFDDVLASAADTAELEPDMVVYVGGHIVSKRIKHLIRKSRPAVVWHVTERADVVDLFQCVSRMVYASAADVLYQLATGAPRRADVFAQAWQRASQAAGSHSISTQWTEQNAVALALEALPEGCAVALANSSSVRWAQRAAMPKGCAVVCNRGVNGIEGSMSAAVGYAMASQRLTFLIIGDLSFFYDMNALWNVALPANLRILLINNGGGAIFGKLPGLEASEHRNALVAAGHAAKGKAWCQSCGCQHTDVADMQSLREAMAMLTDPAAASTVVVEAHFAPMQ